MEMPKWKAYGGISRCSNRPLNRQAAFPFNKTRCCSIINVPLCGTTENDEENGEKKMRVSPHRFTLIYKTTVFLIHSHPRIWESLKPDPLKKGAKVENSEYLVIEESPQINVTDKCLIKTAML